MPSFEALESVASRLRRNGIEFALGGAGMLYALGLLNEISDWDLTTDAPFEVVRESLRDLDWERVGPSEQFKSSYFIKITLNDSLVEIIGGFSIRTKDGLLYCVPSNVFSYWNGIPLADPKVLRDAYLAMGRLHRVAQLDEYLRSTDIAGL
jgi:hypothetical protein